MEGLELDKDNRWVLWKTEAEQVHKNVLGWRMLENNRIDGLLPFDYFYVDNQICFRYAYRSLQRIEDFFRKKEGDVEVLHFLCREILAVLERGQEYLLEYGGYMLLPEWIFWNRYEKKVYLCYLPGKEGNVGAGYTALVEYLMRYTDHSDKRAVALIYGLYDLLSTDGFVLENLISYLRDFKFEESGESVRQGERQADRKGREDRQKIHRGYVLRPMPEREDRLRRVLFTEAEEQGYPVRQGELAVGRGKGSDLYLPFVEISRHHALIFCGSDSFELMDADSANGTYVNGSRISAYVKTPCKEGDMITFADISYQLARHGSVR